MNAAMILLLSILGQAPAERACPAFAAVAFDEFAEEQLYPAEKALREMLSNVPGSSGDMTEAMAESRYRATRLDGLFRINAAWRERSALRMSLLPPARKSFELLFWTGDDGIAVQYGGESAQGWAEWGVYRVTRAQRRATPDTWQLWATDEGRFRRALGGSCTIHYESGRLAMTRGNLLLWSVPLAGPPAEVYFRGSAVVRGLVAVECRDVPQPDPGPPLAPAIPLADLDWQAKLIKDDAFGRQGDAVRLQVGKASSSTPRLAWAAIPGDGLCAVVAELECEDAGAGFILTDERGQALVKVGWFKVAGGERPRLAFGLRSPTSRDASHSSRSEPDPIALSGRRQWVRVLLGAGIARCWTSHDGRQWSLIPDPAARVPGTARGVGLSAVAVGSPAAITLHSLRLERCTLLDGLASDPPKPGQELLGDLIDDAVSRSDDPAAKLRVLGAFAPLVDTSESRAAARFLDHYRRVARDLARRGSTQPFTTVFQAVLPAAVSPKTAPRALPLDLLRYEVLQGVYESRWDDVLRLNRELHFWGRGQWILHQMTAWDEPCAGLLEWAAQQAQSAVGEKTAAAATAQPAGNKVVAMPRGASVARGRRATPHDRRKGVVFLRTGHPLVERLDRDPSNAMADFHAAIESKAWREACQVITSTPQIHSVALVPEEDDPNRLRSLQTVFEETLADTPDLAAEMREHFAALGELRLNQAVTAQDAAAVAAVARQFAGLECASRAHAYLADQALAAGRFAEAVVYCQQALAGSSAEQRPQIAARMRLAAACSGRSLAGPASPGSTPWDAAAAELLKRRGLPPQGPIAPLEPADAYRAEPWAPREVLADWKTSGSNRRPGTALPLHAALTWTPDSLVVNSPSRILVLDRLQKRRRWSGGTGADEQKSRGGAAVMRPAYDAQRFYMRRLVTEGVELAAFRLADGTSLWSTPSSIDVISDPLLLGEELFAVLAQRAGEGNTAVALARLDPRTGQVLAQWRLAEFHDLWMGCAPCQAVATDSLVVVTVGGAVVACDLAGRLRWVRRQTYWQRPTSPPGRGAPASPSDRSSLAPTHAPPLVLGDCVYVTQPGVWAVECLDLATGKLRWRRAEPEILRLLAVDRDQILVETADGFEALDPGTGRRKWFAPADDRWEGGAMATLPDAIVYIGAVPAEAGRSKESPALRWIDASSGRLIRTSPLETPADAAAIASLAVFDGRFWALVAGGAEARDLLLVQLVPVR